MENVTDALYMAVAILILLITLSVSISSFTKVKADVQQIINADERTDLASYEVDTDGDGIPDKEYINYIKSTGSNRVVGVETIIPTIRKIQNESYIVYIRCRAIIPNAEQITGSDGNTYAKIAIDGYHFKEITKDFMQTLYTRIQGSTFNEYIGVYKEYKPNTPDADNAEHRIIIYEEQGI